MNFYYKSTAFAFIAATLSLNVRAKPYIIEITDTPDAYRLIKKDKEVPVDDNYLTLDKGDCITVLKKKAKLIYINDAKEEKTLAFEGNANRCIDDNDLGQAPTKLSNLLDWLNERSRIRISSAGRGGEGQSISVPLTGRGNGLKMVQNSNRKHIYFACQGGMPPFTVNLLSADDKKEYQKSLKWTP